MVKDLLFAEIGGVQDSELVRAIYSSALLLMHHAVLPGGIVESSDTFAEYKLKAAMAGEFKLVKPHVFKFIKGFNDWTNYRFWCEMLSVSYNTLERVPPDVLNSAQLTTLS